MNVIDQNNFEEIINSKPVALVDLWASWCGPCRMLSPTVDDIAEQYEGRVAVAKCNVDDNDELAANFGVRSIPTLLFFKNGELADKTVGLVSKQEIENILNNLL
ncbi:MAG: thioredoxin [Bacteroidales bacterium]|jgi:thioredoxin 1|nr:thioredoxin [Bacteroidales bacterium]